MAMPAYPLFCSHPGCGRSALYKIAARWSDGVTAELKTYALVCEHCLAADFQQSLLKQAACRRAKNEILDTPGIYRLEHGQRDRRLQRLQELEAQLAAPSGMK